MPRFSWAVLGVEGFDALIRRPDDLDRLPRLFERRSEALSARLFVVERPCRISVHGGRARPHRARPIVPPVSRRFRVAIERAASHSGPRSSEPEIYLGDPRLVRERRGPARPRPSRLQPWMLRHAGFDDPRALSWDNLARLRVLGGVVGLSVGPPFYPSMDSLKDGIEKASALPFLGRAGYDGIAIGTDFLGIDATLPLLSNASNVVDWLANAFDPEISTALITGKCEPAPRVRSRRPRYALKNVLGRLSQFFMASTSDRHLGTHDVRGPLRATHNSSSRIHP